MRTDQLPIFVYGTLMRGRERAGCWPHRPRSIDEATIRGRLHDLGPYPALVPGNDVVLGELWHIEADDLPVTLETLDAIECYGQDDVDLYVRRIVTSQTLSGKPFRAYTYFIADPQQIATTPIVRPNTAGLCRWQPPRSGH